MNDLNETNEYEIVLISTCVCIKLGILYNQYLK